jgi:hypothetical protein
MAFRGDQRGQLVHRRRDPLLAYAAPNADPARDRLHVPSAGHLLSQHSPTWDEWTSPGELIHPGDLPGVSSVTSNQTQPVYRWGIRWYSQRHPRGWPRPGGLVVEAARGANREAVSRSSGCRKGLRRQHHIACFGYPKRVGANAAGRPRFAMMIVSQCFWADKRRGVTRCRSRLSCGRCWPVTFPGRVPPLACCRRCLAGYGQSRRAPGLPFGSACAG